MASSVSSSVTSWASLAAASARAAESAAPSRPSSRSQRRPLLPQHDDAVVGVLELQQPAADCPDQASTSSMVSPYLRVSAVSAARRSETAASRSGSMSSSMAYDATSAARSESR